MLIRPDILLYIGLDVLPMTFVLFLMKPGLQGKPGLGARGKLVLAAGEGLLLHGFHVSGL